MNARLRGVWVSLAMAMAMWGVSGNLAVADPKKTTTPEEEEQLNKTRALAVEMVSFNSRTAYNAFRPGSPVGPPQRVTICHKGKTITVAEPAVPAHLAHGDTIGPCPEDRQKGNNGVGNGEDPQPPGNPPINDGPGTGPGNPGNRGGPR